MYIDVTIVWKIQAHQQTGDMPGCATLLGHIGIFNCHYIKVGKTFMRLQRVMLYQPRRPMVVFSQKNKQFFRRRSIAWETSTNSPDQLISLIAYHVGMSVLSEECGGHSSVS